MAGGVGSRYWPLSRESKPKQFIDILGTGKSFIRQTYERFSPFIKDENFIVVTSEKYRSLVLEHIPELTESQILCEPVRRNTAPCICYAANRIASMCDDAVMIVTPADHLITNNRKFENTISIAVETAVKHNCLMTIGIKPSRPETGYGYIQTEVVNAGEGEAMKVKAFTEKPHRELAEVFVECGEFLWNSGIFIWSVNAIKEAFEAYAPDIHALFQQGEGLFNTDKEREFIDNIYPRCENISIDYGIMEKSDKVGVVCADFGWSDVGTWRSMYELSDKDAEGNSLSDNNVFMYNCEGCVVRAPQDKLVITDSLKDYIIVDSGDVLMISPLGKEQDIKLYTEDVRRKKGEEFL